tara:strand:+ start:406 stop:531 length:126 start_codon:yes stop_codon:yes gene_type:complete
MNLKVTIKKNGIKKTYENMHLKDVLKKISTDYTDKVKTSKT